MQLPPVHVIGPFYALSELGLSLLRRSKGNSASKDRGSLQLLWTVILISVSLGFACPAILSQANLSGALVYPVGFALFCLGLILRWFSIVYLGRFFTVDVAVAADHRVVDAGPYRFIRHPAYLGSLLAFVGLGLCLQNIASFFVIIVPVTAVFLRRIAIEETVLGEMLGESYRKYARRTRRLIPFVY